MKKVLLVVLFAFATVCASAQYKGDVAVDSLGGIMVKKGGTLVLDGVEILRNNAPEVMAEDYERWRKTDLGYKVGKGLTITGSLLAVSALASYAYATLYDPTKHESLIFDPAASKIYWGFASVQSACLAIPCLVAGIPTLCVYNSRLKQLATDYNERHRNPDVSLSFGGQNNGIGFALNF